MRSTKSSGRAALGVLFSLLAVGTILAGDGRGAGLLLRGGRVIDPKYNLDAQADVAIDDGKIVAVGPNLPNRAGLQVVDARGLIVTPGLVDIHAHLYASTGREREIAGDLSVYPDGHTFSSGVTTIVDAGSSGWRTFLDFQKHVIRRAHSRVFAFLNVVGQGMQGVYDAEQDVTDMDPEAAAAMAIHHRDVIVGIKTAHFGGPAWTAVDRAVQAGQLAEIPVMVDFGTFRPERPFKDLVLKHMRPGDILTHMYINQVPMFTADGRLQPYLYDARNRGVFFDVGHGCASFVFHHAVPAIAQGFAPDSISTDLHTDSMVGGMKSLPNVMSKFLNMGMPLASVVAACTWHPAEEIHHPELGNLSVGAKADVAVLRLESGSFGFVDTDGLRLDGHQRLTAELTMHDGRVCWDLNGMTAYPWHPTSRMLASVITRPALRLTSKGARLLVKASATAAQSVRNAAGKRDSQVLASGAFPKMTAPPVPVADKQKVDVP